MRNFIQPGNYLTVVAAAAVVSGAFVKVGTMFGVAATSAKAGEQFELKIGDVYEFPKVAAEAWTQGQTIYMTAAGIATTVEGTNTKAGVASEAVSANTGAGRVRLNSNF